MGRPPLNSFNDRKGVDLELKRGAWSIEEDQKLIAHINRYGIWNWNQMPKVAGLVRSGKSCRLRWMNYLRPNIRHGNFTREEEDIIIKWHKVLGNKWTAIARNLSGRTDNEIKNHWNTHLKNRYVPNNSKQEANKISGADHTSVTAVDKTNQPSVNKSLSHETVLDHTIVETSAIGASISSSMEDSPLIHNSCESESEGDAFNRLPDIIGSNFWEELEFCGDFPILHSYQPESFTNEWFIGDLWTS